MIPVLPRREREIYEILCGLDGSLNGATVADVRERMEDPPSYSAVRTMLARLEAKGLICHREQDGAYAYAILAAEVDVRASALKQMVRTFFDGSAVSAATALLGLTRDLGPQELAQLQLAIDEARENMAGAKRA